MTDDILTRLKVTTVADSAENIYETMNDAVREIERLRAQVKAAHKILGSESFGWLVIGSNHEVSHWEMLSPYIDAYWNQYGTYFRPKPNDADS